MYAVGRLGSYISQGVNTVSGPFHPFGGAVDVVVVQQPDGSLKSSPWYVKFGKFQGVLKTNLRIVNINVNGVNAGFHMHLNPRGEAYFLREVDQCDSDRDVSNGELLSRTNSKRSRIFGFGLGKRSVKEENDSDVSRMAQLESAEIAADLLEMRWSTNLSPRSSKNVCRESRNGDGDVIGGRLEASLVLHEEHFVDRTEVHAMEVEETAVTDVANGVDIDVDENLVSDESLRTQLDDANEPEVGLITARGGLEIVHESDLEVASNQGDASIEVVSCNSITVPFCQNVNDNLEKEEETDEISPVLEANDDCQVSEQYVEEQFIFGDFDDPKPRINTIEQEVNQAGSESTSAMDCQDPLTAGTYQEHFKDDLEGLEGDIRRCSSNIDIPRSCEVTDAEVGRKAKSLPNMCQFDDLIIDDHEVPNLDPPVGKLKSSKWDLLRGNVSRIKKAYLENELLENADNLSNNLTDGSIASGGHQDIVEGSGGRWRMWPFRRLGSKNIPENNKRNADVDTAAETDIEKERSASKTNKKIYARALTPTPEQLASLNLAEGKNLVTFTFSTSVLGPQKVDARIYLWRWDTRIVISDVDGTITKSDVLGQFMPLVGRDWSHIGVTHLFSAIKENGYQMLYLSARAISQASLTRQFLFNLKQDGKSLPDGPVVISPDGLFPSFFREVIRRVPHEFKIACLEDIKVCFPSDRNPFYAGFGNRDTDEFSYLKVGIPKGKIFIINPKGEVVINRRVDSRSYSSLHALVNRIFPPVSVHEEEDYNSWNFWKLPPPTME